MHESATRRFGIETGHAAMNEAMTGVLGTVERDVLTLAGGLFSVRLAK